MNTKCTLFPQSTTEEPEEQKAIFIFRIRYTVHKGDTAMTTQELYDLMSKGFDDIKTTLTSIDNRLRNVETDVAELKGRRLAFKEWIPIGCAVIAVIVSIVALVKN